MLGAKPTISHEMSTMNVDVAPVEERALPASVINTIIQLFYLKLNLNSFFFHDE